MEIFEKELKRLNFEKKEGEGIFVLDFSAFFPYSNQEDLILYASLSTEYCASGVTYDLTDICKFNNNCPNKGWITMSRKFGRKLCKIGCPIPVPYDDPDHYKYLNLGYGFDKNDMVLMSIPIKINISEEKPWAYVHVEFNLKDPYKTNLEIFVHEGAYIRSNYSTSEKVNPEYDSKCSFILLTPYTLSSPDNTTYKVKDALWIIFNESIETIPYEA